MFSHLREGVFQRALDCKQESAVQTARALRWEHETSSAFPSIDRIESAVREAAPQREYSVKPGGRDRAWVMPRLTPLDVAIIAGALFATLGLVFIATSSLHGFLSADPPASGREHKASSSARVAVLDKVTTARAVHSHAEPVKGEPKDQGVVTTAVPNDWRNPAPEATSQALRPPTRSSLTVPQEASGSRATPARGEDRAKIVAVPETRPSTLPGWTIRDVTGNTAVLEGPTGVWSASPGGTVPGVGKVHFVVRWGSRWIVGTSKGLITTR